MQLPERTPGISARQQKFIAALSVKKFRQQYRQFVVEGSKMVEELLSQSRIQPDRIYASPTWIQAHGPLLIPYHSQLVPVTDADLHKISGLTTPNQVLAVVNMPPATDIYRYPESDICLFADGIQDPGNLGTLLRIADWFGLRAVFCAPDTVDVYNPKVIQASMGAFLRIQSMEISLSELLTHLPDLPVIGAVMQGQALGSVPLPKRGLLVVGREGSGIREDLNHLINHPVTIPRHPTGGAESLNVGVATGIICAFLRRG